MRKIESIVVVVTLAIACAAFGLRLSHQAAVRELDLAVRMAGESGESTTLPPDVLMLARRLGASASPSCDVVTLRQSGQMWRAPGARPMNFTARQSTSPSASAFAWNAHAWGVDVSDAFVAQEGRLQVTLLGAIPLGRSPGGADFDTAEAVRYLAELPWNPDAILQNRSLQWQVPDPQHLTVRLPVGKQFAEANFHLDQSGLIDTVEVPARLFVSEAKSELRPWHGHFGGYRQIAGRQIPTHGEVAWRLDRGDFRYWRADITDWSCRGAV